MADWRLVNVSEDKSIRVLELITAMEIHKYENCVQARPYSFSPDGTMAVAGSFRAGMFVFRLPSVPGKDAGPPPR